MKKIFLFATIVAMSFAMVMPVQAQSRKDKKAAAKAQWELEQKQQREEAELRHKLRMDSIANAKKEAEKKAAAEEQARKEALERYEAQQRQKEAEERAKQKKAEEAAAMQEVEEVEPCSEEDWLSTEELIRARGVGEDPDKQNSVDDARQAAIKELGAEISTKVQDLLSRNRKSVKKNTDRATLIKVESMTVTEVEQATGFRKACSKTVSFVENGMRVYRTYYVVELPADKILNNIYGNMQEDADTKLDMNFDEFKKEFNRRFGIEE